LDVLADINSVITTMYMEFSPKEAIGVKAVSCTNDSNFCK